METPYGVVSVGAVGSHRSGRPAVLCVPDVGHTGMGSLWGRYGVVMGFFGGIWGLFGVFGGEFWGYFGGFGADLGMVLGSF